MAKHRKGGRKKIALPPQDLYEAGDSELVPDEEKHAGQRYDVGFIYFRMHLHAVLGNCPIVIEKNVNLYHTGTVYSTVSLPRESYIDIADVGSLYKVACPAPDTQTTSLPWLLQQ